MRNSAQLLLSGVCLMGAWACGYFFWRFWKTSRDVLFLYFAAAFWVFSVERVVLFAMQLNDELRPEVYIIRLAGFSLLVWGIVHTNFRKR
ncbi:MAG: DUF5985 family protein [Verrucomicrobiota bacterium]|nr:DUF5985 family protein [Verrucomicrobiota bacterium]